MRKKKDREPLECDEALIIYLAVNIMYQGDIRTSGRIKTKGILRELEERNMGTLIRGGQRETGAPTHPDPEDNNGVIRAFPS